MPKSFLDQIRPEVLNNVALLKEEMAPEEWEERALRRSVKADFCSVLTRPDSLNIIAEIKKASPSRGVLRENFDAVALARVYEEHGAAALSVLTEEKHFQGSVRALAQIALSCSLPILRKDFILDEVQIAQARSNGASAVLLIVPFLTQPDLEKLIIACRKYSLAALVEVHTEEELVRANLARATLLGVNNRDLKTLEVNLKVSERLIQHKRSGQIFVAESGLTSNEQLKSLHAAGYDAFLIGEHFMKSADPGAELGRLRGKP
ncbi:MAG: indole-3-glycerol phosphate synthase TrpC [Acidobacteriia bacterium]|nr:indole-3-glycerol phosphate synthase TrpC [Terriglobia bacterium]